MPSHPRARPSRRPRRLLHSSHSRLLPCPRWTAQRPRHALRPAALPRPRRFEQQQQAPDAFAAPRRRASLNPHSPPPLPAQPRTRHGLVTLPATAQQFRRSKPRRPTTGRHSPRGECPRHGQRDPLRPSRWSCRSRERSATRLRAQRAASRIPRVRSGLVHPSPPHWLPDRDWPPRQAPSRHRIQPPRSLPRRPTHTRRAESRAHPHPRTRFFGMGRSPWLGAFCSRPPHDGWRGSSL